MTAGKIVEIEDDHFVLPEAVSQLFANEEEASNIAYLSQYIGMLGEVETRVVECFYKGGGVPYSAYLPFSRRDGRGQRAKYCRRPSRSHPSSRSWSHPRPAKWHQRPRHRLRTRTRTASLGGKISPAAASRDLISAKRRSPMHAITRIVRSCAICASRFAISQPSIAKLRRPLMTLLRPLTRFMIRRGRINVLAGIRRSLKPEGVFLMQDIRASSSYRGKPRSSYWDAALHDLVHALHDDLPCARRYGTGRNVGRAKVRSSF